MASKTLRLDMNLLPKTTIQKQINSKQEDMVGDRLG